MGLDHRESLVSHIFGFLAWHTHTLLVEILLYWASMDRSSFFSQFQNISMVYIRAITTNDFLLQTAAARHLSQKRTAGWCVCLFLFPSYPVVGATPITES
jgi:hypothetical protein